MARIAGFNLCIRNNKLDTDIEVTVNTKYISKTECIKELKRTYESVLTDYFSHEYRLTNLVAGKITSHIHKNDLVLIMDNINIILNSKIIFVIDCFVSIKTKYIYRTIKCTSSDRMTVEAFVVAFAYSKNLSDIDTESIIDEVTNNYREKISQMQLKDKAENFTIYDLDEKNRDFVMVNKNSFVIKTRCTIKTITSNTGIKSIISSGLRTSQKKLHKLLPK